MASCITSFQCGKFDRKPQNEWLDMLLINMEWHVSIETTLGPEEEAGTAA